MKGFQFLVVVIFLALVSSFASAYDPSPLQDFCVATDSTELGVYATFVNGKFCKDPKDVTSNDFFFPRIDIPRLIDNQFKVNATIVDVDQLPGLNTLGISLTYVKFAPRGLAPPHYHPRSSQIVVVLEGIVFMGFVVSNQNNNILFHKTLYPGDVFVAPLGQIHLEYNIGDSTAVILVAYNSQNPGIVTISNAIFQSNPLIDSYILAKAFQLNIDVVEYLQQAA
ncbi:germin-like protein subfamily 1 member 7 [Carica papaya]|uniref:germin-like protein subfamily 1 member 7 n=1 Tax=Carica papaya TaxID=3649 RepID=UPI000B8CEB09|nr:germin-like protein subfamily 1 member 7 [Carica papaya]